MALISKVEWLGYNNLCVFFLHRLIYSCSHSLGFLWPPKPGSKDGVTLIWLWWDPPQSTQVLPQIWLAFWEFQVHTHCLPYLTPLPHPLTVQSEESHSSCGQETINNNSYFKKAHELAPSCSRTTCTAKTIDHHISRLVEEFWFNYSPDGWVLTTPSPPKQQQSVFKYFQWQGTHYLNRSLSQTTCDSQERELSLVLPSHIFHPLSSTMWSHTEQV